MFFFVEERIKKREKAVCHPELRYRPLTYSMIGEEAHGYFVLMGKRVYTIFALSIIIGEILRSCQRFAERS